MFIVLGEVVGNFGCGCCFIGVLQVDYYDCYWCWCVQIDQLVFVVEYFDQLVMDDFDDYLVWCD